MDRAKEVGQYLKDEGMALMEKHEVRKEINLINIEEL